MQSVSLPQRFHEPSSRLLITLSKAAKCLLLGGAVLVIPASAQTATTTTLTITSDGSAATSIQSGTVVTLTATVMAGSTPVTPGQVEFCDTSVSYCTDIFLVSLSQLTTAGTAVYKFRPGGGSHSYKAVFLGTKTYAGSSSAVSSLDVTGQLPSVTNISASSFGDSWTLTAQVSGGTASSESSSPTGTVSFLDTSNSNAVLATAPLAPSAQSLGFSSTYTLPPYTYNAAVADFNLDGIPDIAQANADPSDPSYTVFYAGFTTFLGNGDGTFNQGPSQSISVSLGSYNGYANGMAVGDFNSDDIPDLVVADAILEGPEMFLGNGDGSFHSPPAGGGSGLCGDPGETGCGLLNVAVADFNGDGIPDLVIGGGGQNDWDQIYVQVLLGNGDGTFGNPLPVTVTTNSNNWSQGPLFVATGDFNHDGIQDLAVANPNNNTVSIYLGNGDGTFQTPSSLSMEPSPSPNYTIAVPYDTIAVADFNKDGNLDLAVTNGNAGTLSIFLGKGDGTFTPTAETIATASNQSALSVGDFNGDGIPDLAVIGGSGTVTVLLGKGDGTFTTSATETPVTTFVNSASPWWSIASGDLNGDGLTDLVASSSVYLAQSGWTAIAQATNLAITSGGTHLVQASYPGDDNFKASASGTVAVNQLQAAAITSPAPGSVLSGSSTTFQWTAGSGATAYKLSIGTKGPGSADIYASPVLTSTSVAVSGLPTTPTVIYVMLSSQIGSVWQAEYYTYTTTQPAAAPVLTTPAPGSNLPGGTVIFTWTPATGVTGYSLHVGNNWSGGDNLYASPITKATSATATGLPTDGTTLYVSLFYEISGTWYYVPYTYTAAGTTAPPVLTTPAPGSQLSSGTVTFTWTPGTGITDYSLHVGNNWLSGDNLYASPASTATSATMTDLPTDGSTLYVSLFYRMNGAWNYIPYTYTAEGTTVPPAMLTPAPGSQLTGSTTTFTWSPGSGVAEYSVSVGTYGPGYFNVYNSPQTTSTSITVPGLPTNGKPLYINLRYQINGIWKAISYTYTTQ